jgi:DNA polymerase I
MGKDFVILGRDNHGKRYRRQVNDFVPYFYVPNRNGKYVSLYGDKLRKVTVDHPAEIKKQRENFQKTYEADVSYVNRYLIDTYKEIPQEPVRVCFLDIEVRDDGAFPDITKADKEVLSISCYDSFNKKFYVFVTDPKHEMCEKSRYQYEGIDVLQFLLPREEELLLKFIEFVNDFDFDLFLAWNGDGFDYPYLFNRMSHFDIKAEVLSPIEKLDFHSNKPRGRTWLDLMRAYRKLSTHELESYGLDYVSNDELGRGKLDKGRTGTVYELYSEDLDTFLKYNINDVWLMVKIEEKRGIVGYFDSVRRLTFSTWYDVFFNSRVLDFYFLKKAKEYEFVLPTKRNLGDNYVPVEGARVIQPTVGMKEWIGVGDVRSLYPTAILTCNMSPETRIGVTDADEPYNGPFVKVGPTYFRTDVRGFIPRVVEDVWDFRQELKSKMREYPVGSPDYQKYNDMQTVAKFLLNSIYGVMLAPFFRLFSREVGAAVTYFGREANRWMEEQIVSIGADVIAGDTDSIFFKINKGNVDDAAILGDRIVKHVNGTLDNFCISKFGDAKYNRMFIEFEKIYRRVLFVGDESGIALKKRYAGLVVWNEGVLAEPILDVKGFETKRSDTPSLYRKMQKELLYAIVSSDDLEVAREEIIKLIRDMKSDILCGKIAVEDIAIPKGMSKPIHEYTKNIGAHIYGAMYYNKYFGGNIRKEKVKYVYVKSPPPGLPHTHVISFIDKCPEGFEIDWDKMANLLINDKIRTIFISMNWNLFDIEDKSNTLEKWL